MTAAGLVGGTRGSFGSAATLPMRHPDIASAALMTRRAWWLVLVGFLIPGSAQVLAGSRRLGRIGLGATITMWVLAALGVAAAVLWRPALFAIAGSWLALLIVQVILVAYAVLWIVLAIDTLRLTKLVRARPGARLGVIALSVLLTVATSGGALYAAGITNTTRDALGSIFTASGPMFPPEDGYYNILLLGADSGDGRDSMRFDSISVVSINADTGAVTITGIPRDMPNFPFAEGPMQQLYPDGHSAHGDATCGWGSGINQLTTEVDLCRADENLSPQAISQGSSPAIEATKDAAEGILGIHIPYYVFLDMNGFAELIDALGGVQIEATQRLPKGGPQYDGQPVDDWAIGWIEPGVQHMDGDTAQWYARSRYTTNDWDRMQRQRQLQEAILAQFSPANVLARFQDIAGATDEVVKTDIPQGLVPTLLDLGLQAKEQAVRTIELTPEGGVDAENPDFEQTRQILSDVLHPEPESTPAS